MDKATAWIIIQTAFRCGSDLQGLLRLLKDRCGPDEYKQFATGIATAIDAVNVQLIDRALAAHPDLKEKIESDLAHTGRIS